MGPLGFFTLGTDEAPGNVGLLDQVQSILKLTIHHRRLTFLLWINQPNESAEWTNTFLGANARDFLSGFTLARLFLRKI